MSKISSILAILVGILIAFPVSAEVIKIGMSSYTGWEPLDYAARIGIINKHATTYGVNIEIIRFDTYEQSLAAYNNGTIQGVTATNIDILSGSMSSKLVVPTSWSNGNDGILSSQENISGQKCYMVKGSVSEYLIKRYIEEYNIIGVEFGYSSESELVSGFENNTYKCVVTWNPHLAILRTTQNANGIFTSANIPFEIIDMLVVNSTVSDDVVLVLKNAWAEIMSNLSTRGSGQRKLIDALANQTGTTASEFVAQLRTTMFFFSSDERQQFLTGDHIKLSMKRVSEILGSTKTKGISFPDGSMIGDGKFLIIK